MAFLTRDAILEADDVKYEVVAVPEWGGDLRLKALTGKERDAFEASTVEVKNGKQRPNLSNLRARLVSLCAVDEDGNRLFAQIDVTRLGDKSAAALQRVFDKCSDMNGLSDQDIEELAEGFEEGPAGSSPSD